MLNKNFFSLSLRQPINQWLCIGLMVSWTLWVVVYYVKNQTGVVMASNDQLLELLHTK